MHFLRRLMGSIGCLVLAGMGIGVAVGAITPEDLARSSERSGRAGAFASIFNWLLETVGAIPAGLIITVLGLAILVMLWLPSRRTQRN